MCVDVREGGPGGTRGARVRAQSTDPIGNSPARTSHRTNWACAPCRPLPSTLHPNSWPEMQRQVKPDSQAQHAPQLVVKGLSTRVPTASDATADPERGGGAGTWGGHRPGWPLPAATPPRAGQGTWGAQDAGPCASGVNVSGFKQCHAVNALPRLTARASHRLAPRCPRTRDP